MPALPPLPHLPAPVAQLVQRYPRAIRRALWSIGALLCVWALAWLLVPLLTKAPLERMASAAIGRSVTIEQLRFKPWSLEVDVLGLQVAGSGNAAPLLTVAHIHIDAELQSVLRMAPVVDALEVAQPHLRLTHLGNGRYDADDVLAKLMAPSPTPDAAPARLALYNLALTGGAVDFTDTSAQTQHALRDVRVAVPFISTLPSQRNITVEPQLAFTLDGSRFDSRVASAPFADQKKGTAHIRWQALNLKPYMAYLPASLPVQVPQATLDVDAQLQFEQHPRPQLVLRGMVQASKVQVQNRQGQDLLAFERLRLDMDDVRPLESVAKLSRIELAQPVLKARRNAQGHIDWLALATPASPAPAPQGKPTAAWQVSVGSAEVSGGQVQWADASTQPPAALQASDVALKVTGVTWPMVQAMQWQGGMDVLGGKVRLQGAAQAPTKGTPPNTLGALAASAHTDITLDNMVLDHLKPYVAQWITPTLTGIAHAELGAQWAAPTTAGSTGLRLQAKSLVLQDWQLSAPPAQPKQNSLHKLEVANAQIDLDARQVRIERLALQEPSVALVRDADGRWMAERWLQKPASASMPAATDSTANKPTPPWRVQLGQLQLQGGKLLVQDDAAPRAVAFGINNLGLEADRIDTASNSANPLRITGRMVGPTKAGNQGGGKFSYQGQLALEPLAAQGAVQLSDIPVYALEGYLADVLSVQVQRAQADFKGPVQWQQGSNGPSLRVSGDAALNQLNVVSTANQSNDIATPAGEELVSWKSLQLRGLQLALAPGAAPRIEVQGTALSDFFARITVHSTGQLNLGQIVKKPAPGVVTAPATPAEPASASSAAAVPPEPASNPAPIVVLGPTSLVNGQVLFTDNFIRPNYSANLSDLTGQLSAFASSTPGQTPTLAQLDLRGQAQGSASLRINGQLNPLAQPLVLDIEGNMRNLDLPPLSPYSIKYAGHGIERGKLNVEVRYKIEPDGKLNANNRIVLNQLKFGDAVEGAPNSLPVRLAVALLADRQGVIDLDLPISGSINDPEFSVGPIVFKAIVNIIGKALVSPFSLLASAIGGGDDLGTVDFAAGSATLTPEAHDKLQKVVKALQDRPNLQVTITGTAHMAQEREGLQNARLMQLLLAEKRRTVPTDTSAVQPDEVPALLQAVYRRTDMPKPRNALGLNKDLPPADMQALLLAHLAPTPAQVQALAQDRALAVQSYLLAQKLPAARIFVTAPQADTSSAPATKDWTPRANLNLTLP